MFKSVQRTKSFTGFGTTVLPESREILESLCNNQTWNNYLKNELKELKKILKGTVWPSRMLKHLAAIQRSETSIKFQAKFHYDNYEEK